MGGFVVESQIYDRNGEYGGVARVYVATQERAAEIASQAPGRTWRQVDESAMPEQARVAMRKARGLDAA